MEPMSKAFGVCPSNGVASRKVRIRRVICRFLIILAHVLKLIGQYSDLVSVSVGVSCSLIVFIEVSLDIKIQA